MIEVTRDQLKGKMDRGDRFVLVEVLPEDSFRRAHLPGAVNLPAKQVRGRSRELLPDRDAEVVVYCASPT